MTISPPAVVGRTPWSAAGPPAGFFGLPVRWILRPKSGSRGTRADRGIGVKIPRQRPDLAPRNVGGVDCVAKILCPARHILTPMADRGVCPTQEPQL